MISSRPIIGPSSLKKDKIDKIKIKNKPFFYFVVKGIVLEGVQIFVVVGRFTFFFWLNLFFCLGGYQQFFFGGEGKKKWGGGV